MKNILSYILTAYAVYTAWKNAKAQAELEASLQDVKTDQELLNDKVDSKLSTVASLLQNDLEIKYMLRVGRPTNMHKLSARLDFSIKNNSTTNTYVVRAIRFIPNLGVQIGITNTEKLFNMYWPSGIIITPGHTREYYISYNDCKIDTSMIASIWEFLLQKFHTAFGWDKLGNTKAEIADGVTAAITVRAGAPYIDATQDIVWTDRDVPGVLRWVGGMFSPGGTPKDFGKTYSWREAKEVFGE